MHEYSVMRQLISALIEELEKKGINKIESVKVEIGELTFLYKEQLQFAYEVLSKDTFLEGSKLEVVNIDAEVSCPNCGYQGGIDYLEDPGFHYNIPVISCPDCGEKPEIIHGKETTIIGVKAYKE